MITYKRAEDPVSFMASVFTRRGSAFVRTSLIAAPCALISAILKLMGDFDLTAPYIAGSKSILVDNAVWSGFTFLVGFLIVFRTSQAYSRFWDGCTATYHMRTGWFGACSALISFCRCSTHSSRAVNEFQHNLATLFSLLHALSLAEIEDTNSDELDNVTAFTYPIIDCESIDGVSLQTIRESASKVELVYHWIQQLIVEHMESGMLNIPAPILSRVFTEITDGMVQFHQAIKISTIPFPFPYAQTCDVLLLMHWLVTPVIISQWVARPEGAFIFTFMQVFIVWCLRFIATEIENPFGLDENDIDAKALQLDFNRVLLVLVDERTQRMPSLQHHQRVTEMSTGSTAQTTPKPTELSLMDVWAAQTAEITENGGVVEFGVARSGRFSNSDGDHSDIMMRKIVRLHQPSLGQERSGSDRTSGRSSDAAGNMMTSQISRTDHEPSMPQMPRQGGEPKLEPSPAEDAAVKLELRASPRAAAGRPGQARERPERPAGFSLQVSAPGRRASTASRCGRKAAALSG